MNTNPSLGTGFAGVCAHAVAAGIIASSRGRARAPCALLRKVLLGIAFFVKNIALPFLSDAHLVICCFTGDWGHFSVPHLKRNTLHDPENDRRKPVFILRGVAHNLANGWRIVVLDASSQSERQQVLRQSCDKEFRSAQQRVFQSIDPPELVIAWYSSGRIDALIFHFQISPLSDGVEVLE